MKSFCDRTIAGDLYWTIASPATSGMDPAVCPCVDLALQRTLGEATCRYIAAAFAIASRGNTLQPYLVALTTKDWMKKFRSKIHPSEVECKDGSLAVCGQREA